jgi:allantoinase
MYAVHVRGSTIVGVRMGGEGANRHNVAAGYINGNYAIKVLDYGKAVVAPGLIDLHVHMNEPGRVEWEGMESATRAAAAGGLTTIVDMPLNSNPCTTDVHELRRKQALAAKQTRVDVGFWAGLVPSNAHEPQALKALVAAGALGFKSFMSPSGVDDFPKVDLADVAAALPAVKALGVPYLLHAELVDDDVPQAVS